MKITFVLPCYPWRPIGAFRVVYEYANQLVSRGHQVSVVHARVLRDEKGFQTPHGLYRRLRRKAGYLRDAVRVPRVRWQEIDSRVQMLYVQEPVAEAVPDADAVFATAWDTVQYVCRYPEAKGNKFHLVQSYDYGGQLDERTAAAWRSEINKIVISKWLGEKMAELGCNDFSYVPNAIDHNRFRLVRPIAERPKRVAMLYAMAECKGSADGLRALSIAKEKHPDLTAVLFGIPKRPRDLPGWMDYFRDPAPHDLVNKVYNSSSIFLCPSRAESFALPAAEAMACGCALATTDCGGNRDYAEDQVNALVSPPGEPEPLARNLSHVLGDEELRLHLAHNGNARVREFSWERSARTLETLVKDVLSPQSKRLPFPGSQEHSQGNPTYAKL